MPPFRATENNGTAYQNSSERQEICKSRPSKVHRLMPQHRLHIRHTELESLVTFPLREIDRGRFEGPHVRVLDEELEKVRHGGRTRTETMRFDAYAVSLLGRKVATGEVKSAKTREKWGDVLEHHLFPAFGHLLIDQIRRADVEEWKAMIGERVQAKTPTITRAAT
jgi:hypothetical protein